MTKHFPSPDVSALEALVTEAYLAEERHKRGIEFLQALVYDDVPEILARGFVEGDPWRSD